MFAIHYWLISARTILSSKIAQFWQKMKKRQLYTLLFPSRTKFQFFVPECNDPYNLPNVKHTRELFQTSLLSFQYWLCEKLLLERHPVPDLLLRMSAAAGRGWVANVFKDVKRSVLWSPSKFWKWGEKFCVWEDLHNCVCKNKVQVKNEFLISINI